MPSHLEDYLSYYKTCNEPGYAVLVTGEWGTGKTHQVQEALSEEEKYYVSLFGLQSPTDIHSELLAKMGPKLAKAREVVEGFGGVGKDMGA